MGKRKSSQSEPLWPSEATIALLAWLDYSLDQGLDFQATVIDYLESMGHRPYKFNQIINKLDNLWRNYRKLSSKETYKETFRRGSSCLPRLPAEDSRALSKILIELKRREPYEQSAKPNEVLETTALAKSQLKEQVHTTGSQQVIMEPTSARLKSSKPEWPVMSEHVQSFQDRHGRGQHSMSAGKRAKNHETCTTGSKVEDKRQFEQQLYITRKQFGILDSFTSDSDDTPLESENGSTDEKEHELTPFHDPDISSGKHNTVDSNANCDEGEEMRILRLELSARNEEIGRLQSSLCRNRATRKVQEQTIESLNSAQTRTDLVAGRTVESWIYDKTESIRKLTRERNDLRQLHIFTGLSESQIMCPKTSDIHTSMIDIRHQINLILYYFDENDPILYPDIHQYGDLVELVDLLFDNSSQPSSRNLCASLLLSLGPQPLVSGLTTAALKSWVFESECLDLIPERSLKLEKYQELLRLAGGSLALRNFDLAASRMMIDDYEFQKYKIRGTAKHLASQLSRTLAPFFQTQASGSQSCLFEAWSQNKTLSDETRLRLATIFESSLMLKLDLLTSTCSYEFLIYPPGSPFDSETMEVETKEGVKAAQSEESGVQHYVELCLHAAILMHARPPITEASPMSEILVQPKNFIRTRSQETFRNPSLILKAVVILKEPLQQERLNEQNKQYARTVIDNSNDDDNESTSTLSSMSTRDFDMDEL